MAQTIRPHFAEAIRAARKAAGMSQRELGLKVGASQTTIAAYETGQNNPPFKLIEKIGLVLGVSPSSLAFDVSSPNYSTRAAAFDEANSLLTAMKIENNPEDYMAYADILRGIIDGLEKANLLVWIAERDGMVGANIINSPTLKVLMTGAMTAYLRDKPDLGSKESAQKIITAFKKRFDGARTAIEAELMATIKDVDVPF